MIKFKFVEPTHLQAHFMDSLGDSCRIDVFLGRDNIPPEFMIKCVEQDSGDVVSVMFNRAQAADLWPLLKHFAETGKISEEFIENE